MRHLPEYIPLVDKVDKTQLYKGPIEIESVVFKEEIVDGKFIQNMIVTRNIRNLQVLYKTCLTILGCNVLFYAL